MPNSMNSDGDRQGTMRMKSIVCLCLTAICPISAIPQQANPVCQLALEKADQNQDGLLEGNLEYGVFIDLLSGRASFGSTAFLDLPQSLQLTFDRWKGRDEMINLLGDESSKLRSRYRSTRLASFCAQVQESIERLSSTNTESQHRNLVENIFSPDAVLPFESGSQVTVSTLKQRSTIAQSSSGVADGLTKQFNFDLGSLNIGSGLNMDPSTSPTAVATSAILPTPDTEAPSPATTPQTTSSSPTSTASSTFPSSGSAESAAPTKQTTFSPTLLPTPTSQASPSAATMVPSAPVIVVPPAVPTGQATFSPTLLPTPTSQANPSPTTMVPTPGTGAPPAVPTGPTTSSPTLLPTPTSQANPSAATVVPTSGSGAPPAVPTGPTTSSPTLLPTPTSQANPSAATMMPTSGPGAPPAVLTGPTTSFPTLLPKNTSQANPSAATVVPTSESGAPPAVPTGPTTSSPTLLPTPTSQANPSAPTMMSSTPESGAPSALLTREEAASSTPTISANILDQNSSNLAPTVLSESAVSTQVSTSGVPTMMSSDPTISDFPTTTTTNAPTIKTTDKSTGIPTKSATDDQDLSTTEPTESIGSKGDENVLATSMPTTAPTFKILSEETNGDVATESPPTVSPSIAIPSASENTVKESYVFSSLLVSNSEGQHAADISRGQKERIQEALKTFILNSVDNVRRLEEQAVNFLVDPNVTIEQVIDSPCPPQTSADVLCQVILVRITFIPLDDTAIQDGLAETSEATKEDIVATIQYAIEAGELNAALQDTSVFSILSGKTSGEPEDKQTITNFYSFVVMNAANSNEVVTLDPESIALLEDSFTELILALVYEEGGFIVDLDLGDEGRRSLKEIYFDIHTSRATVFGTERSTCASVPEDARECMTIFLYYNLFGGLSMDEQYLDIFGIKEDLKSKTQRAISEGRLQEILLQKDNTATLQIVVPSQAATSTTNSSTSSSLTTLVDDAFENIIMTIVIALLLVGFCLCCSLGCSFSLAKLFQEQPAEDALPSLDDPSTAKKRERNGRPQEHVHRPSPDNSPERSEKAQQKKGKNGHKQSKRTSGNK